MERPNKCNDGRLVGMICSAIVVTRRVLLGLGRMGSSTGEYAARMLRGFIERWRSHLCRLPVGEGRSRCRSLLRVWWPLADCRWRPVNLDRTTIAVRNR